MGAPCADELDRHGRSMPWRKTGIIVMLLMARSVTLFGDKQ